MREPEVEKKMRELEERLRKAMSGHINDKLSPEAIERVRRDVIDSFRELGADVVDCRIDGDSVSVKANIPLTPVLYDLYWPPILDELSPE